MNKENAEYCLVYLAPDLQRPDDTLVSIIRAEDGNVVIPWGKGLTIRESILAWAREQEKT